MVKLEGKDTTMSKSQEFLSSSHKALAEAIRTAAIEKGIDKITESITCGGGVMDAAIIAERYNVRERDWEPVWTYPLSITHSRITPALMYDDGTDERLAWYVAPTDRQLADPSFTTANVRDSSGTIRRFKATRSGAPVMAKINAKTFFDKYLADDIRVAALAYLRGIDPADYRKLGTHAENRIRIRCMRWSSVN